ncbi:MAG: endonuclease/exonuclease/phosphatase family protein [Myxococcales bacterium]|nr:endonuclease/exonuclease/phosphatase family protein [Myxococcales bacterium]
MSDEENDHRPKRRLGTALARGRARRWPIPHPHQVTEVHGEAPATRLDPRLRVLVWNVFKGKRPSWAPAFRTLAEDRDLILAQELYFEPKTHALLRESALQWTTATSFSYASRGHVGTGLGTAARAHARRSDALRSAAREPLTGTPKLALLTSYALHDGGEDRELLVVNVHAINFAGFGSFAGQLHRIEAAIEQHDGPLLLAGDFNTWSSRRLRRLADLARAAALEPVEFPEDRRVTILDHAFIRGLRAADAQLHRSRASDHAALSFALEP